MKYMKWLRMGACLLIVLAALCACACAEGIAGSGSCGDNLKWTLNGWGVLRIFGSGPMADYEENEAPWLFANADVCSLKIEEGVTSIGRCAFLGCAGLERADLPASVESVGAYAFAYCTALTEATFANDDVQIHETAFEGCKNMKPLIDWKLSNNGTLTISGKGRMQNCANPTLVPWYSVMDKIRSVVVEDGVAGLCDYAFYECESLTSIKLAETVTALGEWAFTGCSALKEIDIPDGVAVIGDYAFDGCGALTSVSLPANLASVGNYAFDGCSTLKSVSLPDGVKSIGNYAFYGCSALTDVTLSKSLTAIGKNAFRSCSALKNVYVPSAKAWVSIAFADSYATPMRYAQNLYFAGKPAADVVIPEGVKAIGNYAFWNCTKLTSVSIPGSVKSLGTYAFGGCSGLEQISIAPGLQAIGTYAFSECAGLTRVSLPDTVTVIGDRAFGWCVGLTAVSLSDSLETIGAGAFYDCCNLASITLPASVKTVGDEAFSWCDAMRHAYIPAGVESIGSRAFSYGSSGRMVLFAGETVPEMGADVFVYSGSTMVICCEGSAVEAWAEAQGHQVVFMDAEEMDMPMTVTLPEDFQIAVGESMTLEAEVFPAHSLKNLQWTSSAPGVISVKNGVITAHSAGRAVITASGGAKDSVTVSAVLVIRSFRLSESEMTMIAGTSAQLSILDVSPVGAEGAFEWISSDPAVVGVDADGRLSARKSGTAVVTAIADSGASAVCEITVRMPATLKLPADVKRIEAEAFAGTDAEMIVLPEGCTAIGAQAFARCGKLIFVRMPDSVTDIAQNAFEGCTGVTFICASRNAAAKYAAAHGISVIIE